jgi:hypothetical protein
MPARDSDLVRISMGDIFGSGAARLALRFVLDGFLRNRRQAGFFAESYDIDAVIHPEPRPPGIHAFAGRRAR